MATCAISIAGGRSRALTLLIRPATREDIEAACSLPLYPRMRALVAERDGALIGFAGVFVREGRWYGFADLTDGLRAHRFLLARAARSFLSDIKRDGIKYIYAEVSPIQPRSLPWLKSLGFRPDPKGSHFYRWSAAEWGGNDAMRKS